MVSGRSRGGEGTTYRIAGIVRVDGNAGITEHGFWTGGGDDDLLVFGKE